MLAKKYFDAIDMALQRVTKEQSGNLVRAAEMIVDCALSGGRFWVYDKGWAVTSEVTGRAGGLMMIQGLGESGQASLKKDDILVLSAVKNNDPSDASFVEKAKAVGVKTIAILPLKNPPEAPKRLQGSVDLAIDDYAEPGDGSLEVRGYSSKICPTSGVVNAAIVWAVCAEVIDELRRRGKEAHIYKSVFRVGSNEWNAKMRDEFTKTGY